MSSRDDSQEEILSHLSIERAVIVDTSLMTPPTGGAHTFLVHLCAGLRAKGVRVSVVTLPGQDTAIARALEQHRVKLEVLWSRHHLEDERAARLADWVNREQPSVYVISVSPDAGWLALPRLSPQLPTISIAHNDVEAFYGPLRHYGPFIDCAIGVSHETWRRIVTDCGIPEDRTRRIAYGVPTLSTAEATLRLGESDTLPRLRLGYVGRLDQQQKRVLDLVAVAHLLRNRAVSFELHLVGDGPERARLASEVMRAQLSNHIRIWGWCTPEEVRQRMAELDVFVLPSAYEGLPMALLEAMGHAVVPVVTQTASGNTELVRDDVSGLVVPIGDVRGMADRIEALALDRAQLRRLQRGAWETSQDYSRELMVQRYLQCFVQLSRSASPLTRAPRPAGPYPVMPSCRSRYPRWLRKIKAVLAARR